VENVLVNPLVTYFEHKQGKFSSETSQLCLNAKIIIYNIYIKNTVVHNFMLLYQVIIQLHVSAKLRGHLQADLCVGGVYS